LIMSDGQEPDPTGTVGTKYTDWIKGFFATPILHQPGSVFLYNSLGTYMLSAIVQKVTGQKVVDYLQPRLFDPLGITGMDWEMDKQGINTGGWGLRLKTEDMAKFAQLMHHNQKETQAIGCRDIVTKCGDAGTTLFGETVHLVNS